MLCVLLAVLLVVVLDGHAAARATIELAANALAAGVRLLAVIRFAL